MKETETINGLIYEKRQSEYGFHYYVVKGWTDQIKEKAKILEHVNNISVVEIAQKAFSDCKNLRVLEIPSTIEYIWENAFCFARKLREVTFSKKSSLFGIGGFAFEHCTELEKVILPEQCSLLVLQEYTFNGCKSLSDVFLSPSIHSIGQDCFKDTHSLKKINLNNIKQFEHRCFLSSGLNQIEFSPELNQICSKAFSKSKLETIVFRGTPLIENEAFIRVDSLRAVYFKGESVTRVQENAFLECNNLKIIVEKNYEDFEELDSPEHEFFKLKNPKSQKSIEKCDTKYLPIDWGRPYIFTDVILDDFFQEKNLSILT